MYQIKCESTLCVKSRTSGGSEIRRKVAKWPIFAVYFTFLFALFMIPAAQSRAINKITVIVRDSSGDLVEDAKVGVTRIEGGYDRLWRTNASGLLTFVNAPDGNYIINARLITGRFEVGEVEVYVDRSVTVDVSMSTPEEIVIIEDFSQDTRIVVSELTIKPAMVEFNETIEISVVLNNIGDRVGKYNISLRVYGPFLYSIPSNLFGMSMQQVKGGDFKVDSRGFNPNQLICAEGTYTVSYGGLTGSFEVNEPKSSFWDNIPGFTYESIMLGLIAVIIIIWRARKF